MDLRQRWVIARQDLNADWEFFADRGRWTADFHAAVLFYTLWGAEEARAYNADGHGDVRNAAEVAEFVITATSTIPAVEAAA